MTLKGFAAAFLVVCCAILRRVPPPDALDVAARSERAPMNGADRR